MRFALLKKIQWLVLDLKVIRYKREFQESRGKSLPMERKRGRKKKKKEMRRSKEPRGKLFCFAK